MAIKNSQAEAEQLLLFQEESISSSEERRVKAFPLPDAGGGCETSGARLRWRMYDFLTRCVPAGSCGKTSMAYCRITEDETSGLSSPPLMRSGILSRGECWTLNTPEWTASPAPFRSDDGVSSLSELLEPTGNVPRKYFLTRRGAWGILRRADTRGNALPAAMKAALDAIVSQAKEENMVTHRRRFRQVYQK